MASWDFSLGSLVGGGSREKDAMQSTVNGLEVSASAFATAYAFSRWTQYKEVAGISTPLLGGLALSAAGMWGGGSHLANVGHGMLAVYFAGLGSTMGQKAKTGAAMGALPEAQPAFSVEANQAYAAPRKY